MAVDLEVNDKGAGMKRRVRWTISIWVVVAAAVTAAIVLGVRALGTLGIHEFFQKMHGG